MSNRKWLPLVISIATGLVIAALVGWRQGLFRAGSAAEAYRYLCDAFFVPAAVLVCAGLLSYIAYGGFFDIFSYGVSKVKHMFLPFTRSGKKDKSYLEYHRDKQEKRTKPRYYTLKVGLCFLMLAVVCLILFYTSGGAELN